MPSGFCPLIAQQAIVVFETLQGHLYKSSVKVKLIMFYLLNFKLIISHAKKHFHYCREPGTSNPHFIGLLLLFYQKGLGEYGFGWSLVQ